MYRPTSRVARGLVAGTLALRMKRISEHDPEAIPLDDVVAYLNAVKVRASYGAVATLVGGGAQSVASRLGRSFGKRPEASWVVNAKTEESGEIITSADELRRRLAEWEAAGRPARPKMSVGAETTPPPPKPAAPQRPSLSVDDLAAMKRRLTAMLNALEPRRGGPSEDLRIRIERLSQAGGPIPQPIAASMVTITDLSKSKSTALSASECAAVRQAWQAIQGWARFRPGKT